MWSRFHSTLNLKRKPQFQKNILPKTELTEKLTKVNVLNTSQLDFSDLSLSN